MSSNQQLSPADQAAQRELQDFLKMEQQKAQFQEQVHEFTDMCFDKCITKLGNKLDKSDEGCLTNCVERFLDTSSFLLKRLQSMAS